MPRRVALITGATAGLGAEFAQQLARAQHDLILVARNVEKLEVKAVRLRQDFGIEVEVLPADLVTSDGVASVAARLTDALRPVDLLVNNAGFGLVTAFEDSPIEDEDKHLRLLVQTPMELTHAALGPMLARGSGRIINVASVAGFIPRGTYGAAKAWLISFSRSLNIRYRSRGVTVTAVCPGFVHTEFHERMGASTNGIPNWMWLEPEQVVREGLQDSLAGKGVSIPSKRYAALVNLTKFVPDKLASAVGNRGR